MRIETAAGFFAAFVAFVLYKLCVLVIKARSSPLRSLPGPPSPSWIYGNLRQIFTTGSVRMQEIWVERYGETIRYKGWLNQDYLYTIDTKALSHILSHSNDYQKPELARFMISEVIGEGVVVMEGERHRKQRRILNPAFGPAQLRGFTEIFIDKAIQLRNMWLNELSEHGQGVRIDVMSGLNKMTLDAMGAAGFNYDLDILRPDGKPNELADAFQAIFGPPTGKPAVFTVLRFLFPPLRYIPTERTRRIAAARAVIYRVGMQLLVEKKRRILDAMAEDDKSETRHLSLENRDLLSLLLKANMATDIPVGQRLADDEVLAQIPTFLTAGYETTSNAAMWCLYALTQDTELQQKLYAELSQVHTNNPSMDDLQALPFLDVVVRESLRLYAPVPSSLRVAVKDNTIPLQKPFLDVHGQLRDSIDISKGTTIDIALLALNRSKSLWGDDALEFRPDRWKAIPDSAHSIPGVWGDLMTFLGGPRACIGYRFAIVEIKALLFTLVRAFEFKLAVPADEIIVRSTVVRRPLVRGEPQKGIQMPMILRPRQT
ncbi:cytochrome P450 [Laetiporus sulphureus 93-53]|uniref:Cytochrome P450 n=1 Tax=Laetiporus sulphureus 93-53 TaxID=1314785 RepID=A0A165CH22_9APHY|nr:cytochrome P450 [Laetiporus sulphureus 93-53]KZT02793.1 cytochrome P450 [Laetiporus sulphureus 93-53]